MSILTGPEIIKRREEGSVVIEPFNIKNVGPNSYDITLSHILKVYDLEPGEVLDVKQLPRTKKFFIPNEGFVLQPNEFYLGSSIECCTATNLVPRLDGRSSVGRFSIEIHRTAGLGDVSWGIEDGEQLLPTWTLEISTMKPVRVYAGMRIGQVVFETVVGKLQRYRSKYGNQHEPQESLLCMDREFISDESEVERHRRF